MQNYKLHVHSFIKDYKKGLSSPLSTRNTIDHIDNSPFSMSQESIKIPKKDLLDIKENKNIKRA